jgi:hypothetical protein
MNLRLTAEKLAKDRLWLEELDELCRNDGSHNNVEHLAPVL